MDAQIWTARAEQMFQAMEALPEGSNVARRFGEDVAKVFAERFAALERSDALIVLRKQPDGVVIVDLSEAGIKLVQDMFDLLVKDAIDEALSPHLTIITDPPEADA